MNPKYKLVDATTKEQEDFMSKFQDLLNETGMYYEPVPQFVRDSLEGPWKVVCQVILQKKVVNEDKSIPSPFQDETAEPTA